MPVIVRKGGRFGNLLLRILNALYLADKLNCTRVEILRTHPLLRKRVVELRLHDESIEDPTVDESDDYDFFYMMHRKHETERVCELCKKVGGFRNSLADKRMLALKYNVLDIFTFSDLYLETAAKRLPRDIVFQIRSGDIMGPRPHPGYVQYPKFFVEQVLVKEGVVCSSLAHQSTYDDARVVAQIEDSINPVAQWWIDSRYPHNHMKSSLEQAIVSLMHTKCVAIGVGTFGLIPFFLSPVLVKVYVAQFPGTQDVPHHITDRCVHDLLSRQHTDADTMPSFFFVPLPSYIDACAWTASEEQRQLMLTYKPDYSNQHCNKHAI